jgi:hypothetical protein
MKTYADHLAAISEWLYRHAERHRPPGALYVGEIDEIYERWGWRVNRGAALPQHHHPPRLGEFPCLQPVEVHAGRQARGVERDLVGPRWLRA